MTAPTPVEIPRALLEEIYRQARAEYPAECCGWLAGPRDGPAVDAVRACENVQASGMHPTAPERGAETAYVFKDADLLELALGLDGERPARVIYHSHPNGRAYLSETDRIVATSPWGDGPTYPVQQLVVGVDGEAVREARLFAWDEDEGGFVEVGWFAGAEI